MKWCLLLVLLAGIWMTGCTENAPSPRGSGQARDLSCCKTAECLVCKHNADLACIKVDVDARTPRATFAGKEYFFCSDECRKEFQANPAKFMSAK